MLRRSCPMAQGSASAMHQAEELRDPLLVSSSEIRTLDGRMGRWIERLLLFCAVFGWVWVTPYSLAMYNSYARFGPSIWRDHVRSFDWIYVVFTPLCTASWWHVRQCRRSCLPPSLQTDKFNRRDDGPLFGLSHTSHALSFELSAWHGDTFTERGMLAVAAMCTMASLVATAIHEVQYGKNPWYISIVFVAVWTFVVLAPWTCAVLWLRISSVAVAVCQRLQLCVSHEASAEPVDLAEYKRYVLIHDLVRSALETLMQRHGRIVSAMVCALGLSCVFAALNLLYISDDVMTLWGARAIFLVLAGLSIFVLRMLQKVDELDHGFRASITDLRSNEEAYVIDGIVSLLERRRIFWEIAGVPVTRATFRVAAVSLVAPLTASLSVDLVHLAQEGYL